MKRLLMLLLLSFVFIPIEAQVASARCFKPNCWGAIAINTRTGRWGWTVNWPSRAIARSRANAKCGNQCNRSLVFRNSCGSYATPRTFNGGYGWATRTTRFAAEREALRQCRRFNPGQGCRVRVWACTSRQTASAPPPPPPPPPPPRNQGCFAPNCWGAIAINTSNGRWGWTVNHPTKSRAHRRANAKCGFNCTRTLTFRNSCGSYALSRTGGWGWATRRNRRAAEREALRQCRIHNPGQGCRVRVWACTTRR